MIVLLSPSKTLDENLSTAFETTEPRFQAQSMQLIKKLRTFSVADIQELMGVSEKLATLNVQRYKDYNEQFDEHNAKAAALMFKGDVYTGLKAAEFTEQEMSFAQDHIRILSGLYGLLRPLDLMQPYRLEMGSKLQQAKHKNLYEFWGEQITNLINEDLGATKAVVNLASNEYFRAVKPALLAGELVNIHFKENRNGKLKVISFNAKKARGSMARLIVKEQVQEVAAIKELVADDYLYNDELSTASDWLFVKG